MSERMDLPCPYNCGFVYDIYDPLEGRRLLECPECGKPWILEVSYIPFIERRKVEGYSEHIPTEHEIEEDAKYFSEHPEELESGQNTTTNEQNIEESEQKPDNQNRGALTNIISKQAASKSTRSKYRQQQKSSNMDKKFRNQLLAESGKKEEEIEGVNLEIEEREVSENGPFVLIRNKKNKWAYRDWETDRKSTRLNSSHEIPSRMPSSA